MSISKVHKKVIFVFKIFEAILNSFFSHQTTVRIFTFKMTINFSAYNYIYGSYSHLFVATSEKRDFLHVCAY